MIFAANEVESSVLKAANVREIIGPKTQLLAGYRLRLVESPSQRCATNLVQMLFDCRLLGHQVRHDNLLGKQGMAWATRDSEFSSSS